MQLKLCPGLFVQTLYILSCVKSVQVYVKSALDSFTQTWCILNCKKWPGTYKECLGLLDSDLVHLELCDKWPGTCKSALDSLTQTRYNALTWTMWFRSCSTSNRITQLTWGIDHKMYLYFQLHLKTFYLSWIPASTLTLLLVMDLGFDVGTSPGYASWLWHWCWSSLTASILVLDISLDNDTLPCLISWPWHLTPLCVLDLGFEIGTPLCPGSEPWHWHPSLS